MRQRPILIVGAGPAGLSCALWLKKLGLTPWVVDRTHTPGGLMNQNTQPNDWVLGHTGLTGPQLAERFTQHVLRLQIRLSSGIQRFSAARSTEGGFAVHVEEADSAEPSEGGSPPRRNRSAPVPKHANCAAIVLATGTRIRGRESLVGIDGLSEAEDVVRYGPSCFDDIAVAARGRTLIVGGGDNAAENASMLLAAGGKVVVLARSQFRAQAGWMARIRQEPGASCLSGGLIRSFRHEPASSGEQKTVAVALTALEAGDMSIQVQRIHVLTGYEPNSNFADNLDSATWNGLQHDAQGYLCVDAQGRCGPAGIYAAGDVCNPVFPSVVSAIAQGALVAKTIEHDLRNADA